MTERRQLKFRQVQGLYAIVKLKADSSVPDWAVRGEFTSITRTQDELSIVCKADNLPPDVQLTQRWTCLKLEGPFAFELTGVLLSFLQPLSGNDIPIFAISTYDTDYVLVQEQWAAAAIRELRRAGHELS